MILQRCQKNKVEDIYDFNIVTGQHGRGVYFFLAGDQKMIDYYSKNGEQVYTVEIDNKLIKDLSKKKWDFWEAKKFIYNNPQYKAFIFRHEGYNIPTSKEVLVTDESILTLTKL